MSQRRNGISYGEKRLQDMLYDRVDAYERNDADDLPMTQTVLQAGKDNPPFDAQFDLQILVKYFSVAAGVFTLRTAAYMLANAAALATVQALAFFIFGVTDLKGGFKKIKSQFALQTWTYGAPFVYGDGSYPNTAYGVLDATATAQLVQGDLVLPITASNGGVNYVALVIVRCTNVAYGSLLAAINSKKFVVNRIRYIQNDTSAAGLAQYGNAINWFKLSIFGKGENDSITPNSQKPPSQYQAGIIDLPITKKITPEIAFGSYLNYDAVDLQWSIFVAQIEG